MHGGKKKCTKHTDWRQKDKNINIWTLSFCLPRKSERINEQTIRSKIEFSKFVGHIHDFIQKPIVFLCTHNNYKIKEKNPINSSNKNYKVSRNDPNEVCSRYLWRKL